MGLILLWTTKQVFFQYFYILYIIHNHSIKVISLVNQSDSSSSSDSLTGGLLAKA